MYETGRSRPHRCALQFSRKDLVARATTGSEKETLIRLAPDAHSEGQTPNQSHRDLAAAEAAISLLADNTESGTELLAAAFSVGLRSAVALGESPEQWRTRIATRYGQDVLARARLDAANPVTGSGFTRSSEKKLLSENGLPGFAETEDPLSRDPRTDVPAMRSAIPVTATAGITGVRVPLQLAHDWPVLAAEVDALIDLHPTQRGAHMSRLQEAIREEIDTRHADAVSFATAVAERIANSQENLAAQVAARVDQQPRITSAVTGRGSALDVRVTVDVKHDGRGVQRLHLGLEAQIMTACPCTIAYSRLASEREAGRVYGPGMPPTFTHSQPGTLQVGVTTAGIAAISADELLNAVRGSAVLREAVLKRPDEHDLVERSHRNPQFTEDVARTAAAAVASRVPGIAVVTATASLAESIHPHRAAAHVRAAAADLHAGMP